MTAPFRFGGTVTGDYLVDREEELRACVAALTGAGKLFLVGPRRYGKTSILAAAQERVMHSGTAVLRYDLQAFTSLESFLEALVSDGTRHLTRGIEQFGRAMGRFFARLRPEVSYDPTQGTYAAKLGADIGVETRKAPQLAEAFDGIERLAAESDRKIGVVLDEFQEILALGGARGEHALRAAIQHHDRVGYVFAGSKTAVLADMLRNPERPFYRLGTAIYLGPVPRADFRTWVAERFRSGGIEPEPEALTALFELAADVPYNVQALAAACWESVRERGGNRLSADLARRMTEQIARREDPFYTTLWTDLSAIQRAVLLAVLREDGRELLAHGTRERHGLGAASSVQGALAALETKGVIRREEDAGGLAYRFEDPFFREWVSRVLGAR